MEYGSVFRNEEGLKKGIEGIRSLKESYKNAEVLNKGKAFNFELMEAIELGHQLELSEVILVGGLHRKESRGAHFREDFPNKDPEAQKYNNVVAKAADGSMKLRREPIPAMREDLKQVIEEMK